MGWFTKKGRLEIHQGLLVEARRALDVLKATTQEVHYKHGSGIELRSWDYKSVPLEYRKLVHLHLETLVYWVYDAEAAKDAGTFDALNELREALVFIQVTLTDRASISEQTFKRRQALKAMKIPELVESITYLSNRDDPHTSKWCEWDDSLLADLDEALGWFRTQDELDAATKLRSEFDNKTYPRLMLKEFQDLAARFRALKPTVSVVS
jgi:hypothetical protein